jgi:Mg-chelatase subunit ChlD
LSLRARSREVSIFNLSMLDVMSGALGAFVLLVLSLSADLVTEEQRSEDALSRARSAEEDSLRLSEQLSKELADRRVVFVVDVSESMAEEGRVEAVRAGLRLVATTMNQDFEIDVVAFPGGSQDQHRALWDQLRPLTAANLEELNEFVESLVPVGLTPTREALLYALEPRRYAHASAIFLLSDGEPNEVQNKSDAEARSEADRLVSEITRVNGGVGEDAMNENGVAFYFLSELASRNGGRHAGFGTGSP